MARLLIVGMAVLLGGWLVFDGTRALTKGDYLTPRSGPYAGQLGPWSRVVAACGVKPRGQFMKVAHVVLGAAWLASALLFYSLNPGTGRWALAACSVLSLWYLPFGTLLSVAELCLLLLPGRPGSS